MTSAAAAHTLMSRVPKPFPPRDKRRRATQWKSTLQQDLRKKRRRAWTRITRGGVRTLLPHASNTSQSTSQRFGPGCGGECGHPPGRRPRGTRLGLDWGKDLEGCERGRSHRQLGERSHGRKRGLPFRATNEVGSRVRAFSNRFGCLGAVLASALVTAALLLISTLNRSSAGDLGRSRRFRIPLGLTSR